MTAPQNPGGPVVDNGRAWLNIGGQFFSVPEEQVGQALTENAASRLATPEEVHARKLEQEQQGLIGGTKAALEAGAEGVYTATSAIPRGLAALGYAATGSEALKDFVRETAPENLFPTISGAASYVAAGGDQLAAARASDDAMLAAAEARSARRREWETLTGAAEIGGLILGSVATAGAGGAALGGTARATQLAFGGTALRQGAIAAVEGGLQGAAQPFSNGGTPTQYDVLGQALMGALISGAVGTVATGGVNKLSGRPFLAAADEAVKSPTAALREQAEESFEELQAKAFGKAPKHAQEDAVEAAARQIDPDASPTAARDALDAKRYMDELNAEVRQKIKDAGPNPRQKELAAEKAIAERDAKIAADAKKLGVIDADNWKQVPPALRAVTRDDWIEGATQDWVRNHNKLLKAGATVEDVVDIAARKEAGVGKNLVGVDPAVALGSAYKTAWGLKDSFRKIAELEKRELNKAEWNGFWGPYKNSIDELERAFSIADEVLEKTSSPEAAYLAVDQVRRSTLEQLKTFSAGAANRGKPRTFQPASRLLAWAEDAYQNKLLPHLSDATVWGKQGDVQSTVNLARRDMIQAGKIAENSITREVGDDYGRRIFEADPDKARALLNKLDAREASLVRDKLGDYYDAQERFALAIKEGYELSPIEAQAADDLLAAARASREIMSTVESQSTTTMGRIVGALLNKAMSGTVGAVAGSFGGPVGALLGSVALPVFQDTAQALIRRLATDPAALKTIAGAAKKAFDDFKMPMPKLGPQLSSVFAKGGGTAGAATAALFHDMSKESREKRLEQYEARVDALRQLTTNPALAQRGIDSATGNARVHPMFSAGLGGSMLIKFQNLKQAMPGKQTTSPVPSLATTTASDQDLRKANAYWEATVDPTSVFTDFADGRVDYDKVRFAQKQWPELFNLYRAAVYDQLTTLPKSANSINRAVLTQIDMLLGFNGALSPTIAPDFSKRFDAYNEQLAQQSRPRPGAANLNLPAAQPTHAQRIASGGRSA